MIKKNKKLFGTNTENIYIDKLSVTNKKTQRENYINQIKDYYNTISIEKDSAKFINNKPNNSVFLNEINSSSTLLDDLKNDITNDMMKDELTEFLQKIKP